VQDNFAIGWADHLGPLWSVGKRLNKDYFISKSKVQSKVEDSSMTGRELRTNKEG
jgi:hypothetical protein